MKNLIACGLLICGLLFSCGHEAESIIYGTDNCEHCKMAIIDDKFGAELITRKGKVFKFDATECMIAFLRDNTDHRDREETRFLTVNVASPGTLIDARKAIYLKDRAFKSPMGGNLASFTSKHLAENNRQSSDSKILTWEELLADEQIKITAK